MRIYSPPKRVRSLSLFLSSSRSGPSLTRHFIHSFIPRVFSLPAGKKTTQLTSHKPTNSPPPFQRSARKSDGEKTREIKRANTNAKTRIRSVAVFITVCAYTISSPWIFSKFLKMGLGKPEFSGPPIRRVTNRQYASLDPCKSPKVLQYETLC